MVLYIITIAVSPVYKLSWGIDGSEDKRGRGIAGTFQIYDCSFIAYC